MKWFILLFVLATVLIELTIYRRLARSYPRHLWIRRSYLWGALLIALATVATVLCIGFGTEAATDRYQQVNLWVIGIFMITLICQGVYLLLAWIDIPLGKALGRRVTVASRVGGALALAVLTVLIWSTTEGRNRIEVKEISIDSPRLPQAFDGYRILFFSDMHLSSRPHNNRFIKRLTERINTLQPDLVINGGDLVDHAGELTPERMAILDKIAGCDGVYSVFGNHDLGFYLHRKSTLTPQQSVEALTDKEREMGWHLLNNESVFLARGNDSIVLSGTNYPRTGYHNGHDSGLGGCNLEATYRNIPDSLFNLMIAHTPQNWDEIRATGRADLTLSGHVHAMQLKIPGGKRGWSPSCWIYPRWSGLYQEGEQYLYINDGVGYVLYPMRIGTYPELTLITLHATAPTSVR